MEVSHINKIREFTDLIAWQEGHKLVLMIYRVTKQFPKDEVFALTSQIRRAVVSITSNIAEGFSRRTDKDKLQFYYISLGSISEVQNQILIAKDVFYLKDDEYQLIVEQLYLVQRLVNGLASKLKHNT